MYTQTCNQYVSGNMLDGVVLFASMIAYKETKVGSPPWHTTTQSTPASSTEHQVVCQFIRFGVSKSLLLEVAARPEYGQPLINLRSVWGQRSPVPEGDG